MSLSVKNTLGGSKPEGLYVWKKHEIGSEPKELNESISTLPYNFYSGSAVVLNGEIHILGGADSTKKHYKWNGTNWTSVSTLPYEFVSGAAVVLNGEIHILGSSYATSYYTYHYKWDGLSWTEVSKLPYNFYYGSAVMLDGEIHILGGGNESSYYTNHYKWNGSSWASVGTLPYSFYSGSAVAYNNEIHILGGGGGSTKHYKWDETSWTSVSTLPYGFSYGSVVVFDNGIHILGGYVTSARNYHYKLNGSSWISVSSLPIPFYRGEAVVYNNAIHTLGSGAGNHQTAHYLVYGYATVYTFLDYIVSDKETAYPDGGEKDGYWYEKVSEGIPPEMFGCTKMAASTFTLASRTSVDSYTITHSLGAKPRAIVVLAIDELTVNDDLETFVGVTRLGNEQSGQVHFYHSTGNYYSDSNYMKGFDSIDENTAVLSASYRYFGAGIKYGVLAMA